MTVVDRNCGRTMATASTMKHALKQKSYGSTCNSTAIAAGRKILTMQLKIRDGMDQGLLIDDRVDVEDFGHDASYSFAVVVE
ncbi:hypothetical protein CJ030_MR2G014086 [Morella rubra]|uniref:Uncharacterized protein n=1 Tax=Morella rubra TaxID=262757 RepID=A0A6A1VD56_9ROSI|nr:hypothetical protein CJ030_MR6G019827 [Morella rubra]KAB1222848.1 hypothetical protein CJ030_MR2G014087 [Morella rubra]KAB1222849.1 hypothetical protein CJ030_MR2G014086 [Morella rubra]